MPYPNMTKAVVPAADENFSKYDHNTLLDAAFDFGLTASEFKVYFCLVRLADINHTIEQSLESLASECRIKSRNTIRRAIESLVNMGIIRRLLQGGAYIYHLTDSLDWVEHNQDDQKLIDQKLTKQQDSRNPLKGGSVESIEQRDQSLTPSKTDQETEPITLDEKVEVLRQRGCNIGMPYIDGVMVVMVDQLTLSISEFMERSLDSFDRVKQYCAEGVAMFVSKIDQIRARIKQKKLQKLIRQSDETIRDQEK